MAETQLAMIDRFTNAVIGSYGDVENGLEITDKERDIIKGYFIAIDSSLAEQGIIWNNVELKKLAPRLVHYARLGLDMQMSNHLFAVPFKQKNGKFALTLMPGYEGRVMIAKKFAINPLKEIVCHLVGKNDTFKAIYRDSTHEKDDYVFETNPFDKGDIVGGFAYVRYEDETKNKLVVMTKAEILKHKPSGRGEQFWGKWADSMYLKTLTIAACKTVVLDADKVRDYKDDLEQIKADELNAANAEAEVIAEENMCSGEVVDIDFNDEELDNADVDLRTGEIIDVEPEEIKE